MISGVRTPFIGVVTPITHLFSAIWRGPITPFISGLGAHLVVQYKFIDPYWDVHGYLGSMDYFTP